MMRLVIALIAFGLVVSHAESANAKPKAKRLPPDVALERKSDINLGVPQSQVKLEKYAVANEDKASRNFELSASSWSPTDLHWASQVSNSGSFHTVGPQLSANFWRSQWETDRLAIAPKFGFSFAQLTRVGTLEVLGHNNSVKQSMNLYALRAGAEVTPKADLLGHFQPFVDVALLPAWQQVALSEYGVGENHIVMSLEETAGIAWRSPTLATFVNATNIGIEIGLQDTQGLGSNVGGFGVFAGSRLEL